MKKTDLDRQSYGTVQGVDQYALLRRVASYIGENTPTNALVFKGELFLGEYTGVPCHTQCVTVAIVSDDLYQQLCKVLDALGRLLMSDGSISNYEIKDTVAEGRPGGAKYRDTNGRILASVDVSLLGATCCIIVKDTQVAGVVQLSSVEQMLADKLAILYSSHRCRRVKDLLDAWQIITSCPIDNDRLQFCLEKRGLWPLPITQAPFNEEHYEQVCRAYNVLVVKSVITKELFVKPTFYEIVQVVGKFTIPLMEGDI